MSHVAVLRFPGACDELDAVHALERAGHQPVLWFHRDPSPPQSVDGVVLPGGFSYGDYLRTGFLAAHAPAMAWVRAFAADGGPVLGICNGFQVLCEMHLLAGALLSNAGRRFVCRQQTLRVEDVHTPFTRGLDPGDRLRIPVKHGQGRYVLAGADPRAVRVVLRYAAPEGNPNGSEDDIAAVANEAGNVVGLMPHPEHAVDALLGGAQGSADGLALFGAFAVTAREHAEAPA